MLQHLLQHFPQLLALGRPLCCHHRSSCCALSHPGGHAGSHSLLHHPVDPLPLLLRRQAGLPPAALGQPLAPLSPQSKEGSVRPAPGIQGRIFPASVVYKNICGIYVERLHRVNIEIRTSCFLYHFYQSLKQCLYTHVAFCLLFMP